MAPTPDLARRLVRRLARRLDLHVRTLDDGTWVLGRGAAPTVTHLERQSWLVERGEGLRVDPLDRRTWLLNRRGRGRRHVTRIGGPRLRTSLVFHPGSVSPGMSRVQGPLTSFLGQQYVATVLQRLEANVVLDVGANTGQFARGLREAGYAGRIVSFEPVPHLFAELQANAADDPAWFVHPCALGDEDATAEINVAPGPGKVSSLLPASEFGEEWNAKLRNNDQATIDVRRLDGLLDRVTEGVPDPRVFLKLDTQGYDVRAVRGAGERIRDILGLQSEVAVLKIYEGMPGLPEQLAEYESHGFEVSGIFSVSRHSDTMRAIEFDLVMVRPDEVRPAGEPPR